MTPERTGDGEVVARLLRAEAQQFRPDPNRIARRVGRATRGKRSRTSAFHIGGLPARAAGLVAVAATVAGVVVAVSLLRPSPESQPVADPDVLPPPPPTDESPTTSAETDLPPAPLDVDVTRVDALDVSLGAAGTLDWLIAGVDPSDPTATARSGTDEELLTLSVEGFPDTVVADGPFSASWTGGLSPRPEGSSEGRWLLVGPEPDGPESGIRVRADLTAGAQELIVHVGVTDGDAGLEIDLGNEVVVTSTLVAADEITAYVVTVPLGDLVDSGGVTRVEVDLLLDGNGSVGVLAAHVTGSPE